MESYIKEKVQLGKLLIILVGVSGCGKSTLVKSLISFLPHAKVFSLDEFRVIANNGVYPRNEKEHMVSNRFAIPAYQEAVKKEKADVIILDNTHLKWDPDWRFSISKALSDGYNFIALTPPVTEYALFTNRSTHNVDDNLFLKMVARHAGYSMRHLLNVFVPNDKLPTLSPIKPDSFSVNKMFTLQWGAGYLYVLDGYLGYIDREMVRVALKAGNLMASRGWCAKRSCFPEKDSLLHITIVQPRVAKPEELKQIARNLVKSGPPPILNYTGLSYVSRDMDSVYFLSIGDVSQNAWRERLAKVAPYVPINTDGLHVTLSFGNSDIWGVAKTGPPKVPIEDFITESETFDICYKDEDVDPVSLCHEPQRETIDWAQQFRSDMRNKIPQIQTFVCLKIIQDKIGKLLSHRNIKTRLRRKPTLTKWGTIYTLSISIFAGYKPDDIVYKENPDLQRAVPRGLCYVFALGDDQALRYINVTFPTPKFFGDNDTEQDVEVLSDKDLMNSIPKDSAFIVTEKANGEMYTFSVAAAIDRTYLIVLGSKNNKFAFEYEIGMKNVHNQIQDYLEAEERGKGVQLTSENLLTAEWTNKNLWVEMVSYTTEKLATLQSNALETLFEDILTNNWTLCGEFESYLHPHLEAFPDNYRCIKFFAATTFDESYNCLSIDANVNMRTMIYLQRLGLDTVKCYRSSKKLLQIRREVMEKEYVEGVVLLVVSGADNKIHSRVKLKSLWYVVHRGIREKLRRILKDEPKGKKVKGKVIGDISMEYDKLDNIMHTTVKQKLDIFSIDHKSGLAKSYFDYLTKLGGYVKQEWKKDKDQLLYNYRYRYPQMIKAVSLE